MDSNAHLSDMLNLSSRTSTFVSIDVMGSTQLKMGQNEQDIIYTFLAYHKLVSDFAYAQHGEVISITGDGMMCRFQKAEDAIGLVQLVLSQIPNFNKKQNRLTKPLAIRIGVHTGEVLESESLKSGQIISNTLDVTAKLQQGAQANQAQISEATVSVLGDKAKGFTRVGWNAALGTNVYAYAPEGTEGKRHVQKLPDPARVLVVEADINEIAKMKKTLFGSRYDTFTVFNQNQATLALGSWLPHLVLLSLDLAWKTGWEFLTSLRADARMSPVPIIAISNETKGEIIQRAFKIGANGFLRKPMDEQQILKRIEMVLREFYL